MVFGAVHYWATGWGWPPYRRVGAVRELLLLTTGERQETLRSGLLPAILTDSHFWLPVVVLIFGVVLLIYLH